MDEVQAPALMSQADYARYRRCSPAYISQLKAQGRLVLSGELVDVIATDRDLGAPDAPTVIATDTAPSTDLAKAQLKLIEAQAALMELRFAERARELVEHAEITTLVANFFGDLSDKLLMVPMRIAGQLMTLKTEREVSTALTAALEDVLRDFTTQLAKIFTAPSALDAPAESDVLQDQAGECAADRVAGDRSGTDAQAEDPAQPMG